MLVIAFIPMFWLRNANKFTKEMENAPMIDAVVVKCDEIPRDENFYRHYLVTYEYYDPYGAVQYYAERSDKNMAVGEVCKRFLVRNNQGYMLVDAKVLKENKQASSWPLYLWTIGITIVAILVFIMNHSTGKIESVIKIGFFILIAMTIIFAGFYNIKRGINKSKLRKHPQVREITGTIVDYRTKKGKKGRTKSYFPVFECIYNGNVFTYKRTYSMSKVPTLGDRGTLYIDTRNNRIFENGEIKVHIFNGILFGVVGLLVLAAIIMGIVLLV